MKDDILIGDTPKARARRARLKGVQSAGRLWKHSTLADIAGLVSEEEIARSLCFALVRNPWDRAVSYYRWLREQSFAHPAVGLARCLDFSGFLNHPQTIAALRSWPYGAYMRDGQGREHPAALYLRLEDLEQRMPELEARLGLRIGTVARVNGSDRDVDWRAITVMPMPRFWADSAPRISRGSTIVLIPERG